MRQAQPNTGIDRRPSLFLLERAEPFRTGHRTREDRGEQGSSLNYILLQLSRNKARDLYENRGN